MHIEMDLALITVAAARGEQWRTWLPRDYVIADGDSRLGGLVITRRAALPITFDAALREFLDPLMPLAALLREQVGVLRATIFFDTPICSLRVSTCERLARLGLALDLSIHPMPDRER